MEWWRIFGVPVLNYHKIGFEPDLMTVTLAEFEADLLYLKDHSYQTITLTQLADYMEYKTALLTKPILISFDDGYHSHYEIAFPLLECYGFQANFNVVVKWVGRNWTMNWAEMVEMERAGVADIQSHTYDQHRMVPRAAGGKGYAVTTRMFEPASGQLESPNAYYQRLYNDFWLAKQSIEDHLGHACQFLCYPYHKCNEIARNAACEAGYRGQIWGKGWNRRGDDLTMIKRITRYPGQPLNRTLLATPLQVFKRALRKSVTRFNFVEFCAKFRMFQIIEVTCAGLLSSVCYCLLIA